MSDRPLRVANLIIAGTGKSGTTSLFHYLRQHPDVCGARTKETHFFSPLREGGAIGPLAEYARYFDGCGDERYRLEATPAYCTGGAPLIAALKEHLDRPRIIISLRDPAERLWDSFRYMKSKLIVDPSMSFERYLDEAHRLRAEGRDTDEENRLFSWSRGFYADWLLEWMEAFGDDLRVVFFERMIDDPPAVVMELCSWLGLDPAPVERIDFAHHNPTRAARSRLVQGVAFGLERASRPLLRSRPALKARLKAAYLSLNARGADERFDTAQRARLNRTYRPSNARVAHELLARGYGDLPAWLTDAIDATSPLASERA